MFCWEELAAGRWVEGCDIGGTYPLYLEDEKLCRYGSDSDPCFSNCKFPSLDFIRLSFSFAFSFLMFLFYDEMYN